MADHAKPTTTSHYADVIAELGGRLQDLARGLDPATSTPTNLVTGAIRWSSAAGRWEKWGGSSWGDLATTYAIGISGNAATATKLATARKINGVDFDGSSDITVADGTKQAASAELSALAGLAGTGLVKRTSVGAATTVAVTAAGEALLSGANATAQRATLGLGTAATAATGTADAAVPTNADLRAWYALRARPIVTATLDLDFAEQSYSSVSGPAGVTTFALTDRVTFGRTTAAWRLDHLGLVTSVSAGVPRITYNPANLACRGLLIEEGRTNLLLHSSDISQSGWTKTGLTVDSTTYAGPDGTMSARRIVETASATSRLLQQVFAISGGTTYTVSADIKAAQRTRVRFTIGGFSEQLASNTVDVNLATGTYTATDLARTWVEARPDGWYRVGTTSTTIAAPTSTCRLNLLPLDASSSSTYAGDGVSGLLIGQCQAEVGAMPLSAIVTGASQVQRTADACSVSTVSWLRQGEGTICAEFVRSRAVSAGASPRVFSLHDGTASNRIDLLLSRVGSESRISASLVAAGGTPVDTASVAFTPGNTVRAALAWRAGDAALYVDGVEIWTGSSAAIPAALATLQLGADYAGANLLNGALGRVRYYPVRLSAAQCNSLTA